MVAVLLLPLRVIAEHPSLLYEGSADMNRAGRTSPRPPIVMPGVHHTGGPNRVGAKWPTRTFSPQHEEKFFDLLQVETTGFLNGNARFEFLDGGIERQVLEVLDRIAEHLSHQNKNMRLRLRRFPHLGHSIQHAA